ncbi:MAG: FAD-binding oxidoreductase, partial [Pseudomonadota bacterium]
MSVATASAIDDLTGVLKQICGPEHVISDPNECAVFSQDIWQKGETADLIVAPANSEETAKLVEAASTRGVAVYPRGGGMSYTNGYTPATPGGVIIDFTRMNRVVEINAEDMYVTVEAGCTWQDLHIALKPLGLRTPFWGPLSGISSTIGGGLSQNNAFFGAGTYG